MLVAIAASIVWSVSSHVLTPMPGQWPGSVADTTIIRNSPMVKRLADALSRPPQLFSASVTSPAAFSGTASEQGPSSVPNAGHFTAVHAPPELIARASAAAHVMMLQRQQCRDMEKVGDYPGARLQLEALLQNLPCPFFANELIDVEIFQGDYIDAYKVASAFVAKGDRSRELLVREAVAASALGQYWSGERQYLISQFLDGGPMTEWGRKMPQEDSLLANSVLARIGYARILVTKFREDLAIPQMEVASQLDPTNPVISCILGSLYHDAYRYSLAIATVESGLSEDLSPTFRETLVGQIRASRILLALVGDGNAPPLPKIQPPHRRRVVNP